MKKRLINRIRQSRFVEAFLRAPMPSWLVLAVDIIIVALAAAITFTFNPYHNESLNWTLTSPLTKAVFFTLLFCVVMFIFKPYRSIVRLSAFEDTYRIAQTIFVSFALLIVAETILIITVGERYFGVLNILTVCFVTFALLVSMRMAIKYLYVNIASSETKRTRVVFLGTAINSFALATALKNEVGGQFEPVLMLSQTDRIPEKRAGGIPIRPFNPDNIREVFDEFKCNTLLFLSTQMEFIRSGAGDVFLHNGIRLLMLNKIEEFTVDNEDASPRISAHVRDIKIDDLLGREPIVTDKSHVEERLRGQVIMITGAAGSIGSEIVRQVATFGAAQVVLVDQAETPMHELQLELESTFKDIKIELCIADVANYQRMERIFEDFHPRIVYHAAAYKHVPMMERNPCEAAMTNVFGTKNIADLSLKYKVEKFVMISTDKAVNPTNVMGASKRVAEIYVQSLAQYLRKTTDETTTKFITTRFGNVLGSNGSVIPLFQHQIETGGPVTVTHRDIIRYFMTIPEACSLVLEAGCMGHGGEIFIFDMGKPVKIYDLATRMISLAGLRPGVDIKIVETGLRPGEKLYEELLNNREMTLATHHKKIMIAKVRVYDYEEVCESLETLRQKVESVNFHDIVAQMKRIVPEFKSRNSKWDAVDAEVKDCAITEIIDNQNY